MSVKIIVRSYVGVLLTNDEIWNMKLQTTYKWECLYKMEGEVFVSESYSDLVSQMRKIPFDRPSTNKEHRETTKRAFYEWDRTILDDTSDKSFILSLIDCNYLKVLSCNRKPLRTKKNSV